MAACCPKKNQLMVNCWVGCVVWIPWSPHERDCYLRETLESQTTNPNPQLTISWKNTWKKINCCPLQPPCQWCCRSHRQSLKSTWPRPHARASLSTDQRIITQGSKYENIWAVLKADVAFHHTGSKPLVLAYMSLLVRSFTIPESK